jgi:hypothetical protein
VLGHSQGRGPWGATFSSPSELPPPILRCERSPAGGQVRVLLGLSASREERVDGCVDVGETVHELRWRDL